MFSFEYFCSFFSLDCYQTDHISTALANNHWFRWFFFVSNRSFICALNTAHSYLIAFCMHFFFVGLNFFHFPLSKYLSICKMVAHVSDSFTIFTPILYPFTLPHRKKMKLILRCNQNHWNKCNFFRWFSHKYCIQLAGWLLTQLK